MTLFVHTSDWQLGMVRHFLSDEAQARFTQARIDVIRTIGRVATEHKAEFVVVAGDVFESNLVNPQLVARSLQALRETSIQWYLLPGNHDPLDAASVYKQRMFLEQKPGNVRVLSDSHPVEVSPGVDIVGAPWTTKRPLSDLVAGAVEELPPAHGRLSICVGHGAVDIDAPDKENPSNISFEKANNAIANERIQYLALGDRHSSTVVGGASRIRYSGAPEPTDYDEIRPGFVLLVNLTANDCGVEEVPVAKWRFVRHAFDLAGDEDVQNVKSFLDAIQSKETTIAKLAFKGALSLAGRAQLSALLENQTHLLGAIESWDRETDLVVQPSQKDLESLNLTGYAKDALEEIVGRVQPGSSDREVAEDALALLYRLCQSNRARMDGGDR